LKWRNGWSGGVGLAPWRHDLNRFPFLGLMKWSHYETAVDFYPHGSSHRGDNSFRIFVGKAAPV
jgi:hypothetical protein